MTLIQKIIKYSAIAFGVFIIVSVCLGIVSIFNIPKDISKNELKTVELLDGNVSELSLNLEGMNLIVETGEALSVQTNNDKLNVRQTGERIVFTEQSKLFQRTVNGTLKISLPADTVLSLVEIDIGAGSINIQKLTAKKINFDLGAGKVQIDELYVQTSAEIECGAGEFSLEKGEIHNLDMDLGVGKTTLKANVFGNSEMNCGVGELNVYLTKKSDYQIDLNKGIGSIKVNGKECNDFGVGGGVNKISIDGGVGAINLYFDEE
ncbi:MAG: DUF4097 domain-containing protein [Clostridiales bacterium]|nr:DUF4097 domain-containing protein [Clostridiales bacterium]